MKKVILFIVSTIIMWMFWSYLVSTSCMTAEGQGRMHGAGMIGLIMIAWCRADKRRRFFMNLLFAIIIMSTGMCFTFLPLYPIKMPQSISRLADTYDIPAEQCEKVVTLIALSVLLFCVSFVVDCILDLMLKRTRSAKRMAISLGLIPLALAWQLCSMLVSADKSGDNTITVVQSVTPLKTNTFENYLISQKENRKFPRVPEKDTNPTITRITPNFDVRTKYDVTADELNRILKGVLKGKGSTFVASGKKHGINPIFLASIAIHESGNGSSSAAKEKNNPVGAMHGKTHDTFDSIDSAIEHLADRMENSHHYVKGGNCTIAEIQRVYCPVGADNDPKKLNKYWLSGVVDWMNKICKIAERDHSIAMN